LRFFFISKNSKIIVSKHQNAFPIWPLKNIIKILAIKLQKIQIVFGIPYCLFLLAKNIDLFLLFDIFMVVLSNEVIIIVIKRIPVGNNNPRY
jgi:hypothetical protein